jgi:hypothetical protein
MKILFFLLSHNSSFICGLFNGAFSSVYTTLNGMIINEWGIGKDVARVMIAYFKVLSWHLAGETKGNHEKPHQDSQCPSTDMNQKSPENRWEALLLQICQTDHDILTLTEQEVKQLQRFSHIKMEQNKDSKKAITINIYSSGSQTVRHSALGHRKISHPSH